jgi:SAM-dependent methyltransferase
MSDYLNVVYDPKDKPYTDYPGKLCAYLFASFSLRPGMKFLEAGCGRGEFLKHFQELGLDVKGIDISPEAPKFQPAIDIQVSDIEKNGIPYADGVFDIVYSKSLLEHFYHPERYINEAYRVLKTGGLLLTLVPDWEANYKIYFDDYTHRTPFTRLSLEDIYKIAGFTEVKAIKFRQLPKVWEYPLLNHLCAAIAPFVPVRTKNKTLRWARELMLVGSGRKP